MVIIRCFESKKRFCVKYIAKSEMKFPFKNIYSTLLC